METHPKAPLLHQPGAPKTHTLLSCTDDDRIPAAWTLNQQEKHLIKKGTGNIKKRIFFVCVSAACVRVGVSLRGCVRVCGCRCRRGVWARGRVWVCGSAAFKKCFCFSFKRFTSKLPKTPGGVFSFEFFTSLSVLFVFSYYKTRKKLKKLRPDFWEAYY